MPTLEPRPVLVRHLVARLDRPRPDTRGQIAHVWARTPALLMRLDPDSAVAAASSPMPRGCLVENGRLWRPLRRTDGAPADEGDAVRLLETGPSALRASREVSASPLMHPGMGGDTDHGDAAADLVPPEWLGPGRAALVRFVGTRLALVGDAAYVRMPLPCLDGTGWPYPMHDPDGRALAYDRTGIDRFEDHARWVARHADPYRAAQFLEEGRAWRARDGAGRGIEAEPCPHWLHLSAAWLVAEAFNAVFRARRSPVSGVPDVSRHRLDALARHITLCSRHALPDAALADAVEDAYAVLLAVRDAWPGRERRLDPMLSYVEEVMRPGVRAAIPDPDAAELLLLAP